MIRGEEAARAIRVDGLERDALVLQRRADLRSWVGGHAELDMQLATRLGVDTRATPVQRNGEAELDKTTEDIKDLVDRRGCPAGAAQEVAFRGPGCLLDGPDTEMHLLKQMLRFGGSPRGWLEMWCREHHIDRKDRAYHELQTLTEDIMLGGTSVASTHR